MLTSKLPELLPIGDAGIIALLGYATVFFGIILLMVVGLIACFAHRDVREFLIPGDATATVYATTELLEEIKEGTPMMDAFAAFCQTVAGNES